MYVKLELHADEIKLLYKSLEAWEQAAQIRIFSTSLQPHRELGILKAKLTLALEAAKQASF